MDSTYEMVKELIDFNCEGVDTYNHNGSTWLIFTDNKKWVIELTKEKTLWYNYYFFTGVFKYLSLDVVENQHYITKWVEDTVINGVKSTQATPFETRKGVEDTLQNGVKSIKIGLKSSTITVEDTLQNGVKSIKGEYYKEIQKVEYTIQNGVKSTQATPFETRKGVEDTIINGVKKTKRGYEGSRKQRTKDTIQNGVKVTYSDKIPHEYDWSNQFTEEIDDIIQNGVKHTEKSLQIDGSCVIEDVIKEGVKHTEYGDWLDGDERFDDIIENGIKETTPGGYLGSDTGRVEGVIKNGVKKTVDALSSRLPNPVEDVIKNGVKECIPSRHPLYNPMDFSVQYRENHRLDDVASVLEKGIKEVQPLPSQEGNMDWGNYYHRQEDRTKPHTKYVDDVITNGIKETWGYDKQSKVRIDSVLEYGVKDTVGLKSDLKATVDAIVDNSK